MTDDVRIPVIEEQAHVSTRVVETERVRVRLVPETEAVAIREQLTREHVEVVRVPIDREVGEAPAIRTEGDVTIVPVTEERLIIEKRLFLVEELHLRRRATMHEVAMPETLRRTRVEVSRDDLSNQGDH
jgi:stress response protein YsnF